MSILCATRDTCSPTETGRLRVLFFGAVGDQFGRSLDARIPADGCDLAGLKSILSELRESGGEALSAPGVRAAVDQQMVLHDAVWVRPGQEVAFFSAFSGG